MSSTSSGERSALGSRHCPSRSPQLAGDLVVFLETQYLDSGARTIDSSDAIHASSSRLSPRSLLEAIPSRRLLNV